MTLALGLMLMYYYDKTKETTIGGTTINPRNPRRWQFIADYNFSECTDMYLSAAYARSAPLNWDSIDHVTNPVTGAQTSVGHLPAASQTYFITSDSDNQTSVAIGLRHKL